jgi:hypothetical protein
MEPNEINDRDLDFEDDADFEAEDWDEETLGFEEIDSDSIAREIGVRR